MKRAVLIVVAILAGRGVAAPDFDTAMTEAAARYQQQSAQAAQALNQTRTRIAEEKAPLLRQARAAEDRIVAAESEITRFETVREDATELKRKAIAELEELRKTSQYLNTLAHDAVKVGQDALAPGEDQVAGERLQAVLKTLEDDEAARGRAALAAAEFLLARTQSALGGYRAPGVAMLATTNQVVPGTFLFAGPETFFLPAQGAAPGAVRSRDGARHPVVFALPEWPAASARAVFAGQDGLLPADASGGKALRLTETRGTLVQHVRKGGLVAFAILAVGLCAILMIAHKLRELLRLAVDAPPAIVPFLQLVAAGEFTAAEALLPTLRRPTRALLQAGLQHRDESKSMLEERLQAVLLELRFTYERRLPLLAVIATAAPLMGLLGTVVGMVKTFALITVFGTGNAGKLSSGISEVLVATELGLAVAIPTLIIHGFLAQRAHKQTALLERYALQFTTAVAAAQSRVAPVGTARPA